MISIGLLAHIKCAEVSGFNIVSKNVCFSFLV